ncbi:hypothetical protein CSUI_005182 [Cystoisospora suis]|uniref:Uncharacterized protein n=1 Tax=Cystoisospora suis TaxID=483139 RepID=A0A2C6KW39_9APIC|nr:hypothetical protein CSUI_005182 [Cystoisospora suis]
MYLYIPCSAREDGGLVERFASSEGPSAVQGRERLAGSCLLIFRNQAKKTCAVVLGMRDWTSKGVAQRAVESSAVPEVLLQGFAAASLGRRQREGVSAPVKC